jgi:hypothetical protein
MTRHRDAVQLHAGREEFRDLADLSARLARAQAKETTLDFERAAYASRRGIDLRSEIRLPEAVRPEPKRGLFDGLRLTAGKAPAPVSAPVPHEPGELARAVDRFACAWTDAARMPAQDLPVLEHQAAALRAAGAALDTVLPGAKRDLVAALTHEPATHRAMMELQGPARTR